jgi:cellulose 1,4-beta-cellobiosidase
LDSTQKMTVVTQFITTDGSDNGDLKEVKRLYVQNGRVIENSKVNLFSSVLHISLFVLKVQREV